MDILAKRLRELRKERGLKQEELAALLGISLSGYTRYEHGERDPNAPTLAAMADFFQVSADYLLGRKEQRE
ncbi:helix-turn-helix transcriptional regulator [uncultured Intestinimonas sp.]|uniref:helix-turn-helix domain-containing protein n=1 Tax=uncultured Intestinimonas sp. TaxID=1689265 RepID=UPI0025DDCEBE|nr:helix-turn-helix transcriptional regulator [uncultured Intestinimonas sp.]